MASEHCEDKREPLNLLQLPEEILENVVSFLTYNETSEARMVSNYVGGGWGMGFN